MKEARIQQKKIAISMRKKGFSFLEIATRIKVPRSTIVGWCLGVTLSTKGEARLKAVVEKQRERARKSSASLSRMRKQDRKDIAEISAISAGPYLSTAAERKAVLGALYLAEGTKGDRGAITFGNSDPEIIKLFLYLFRDCFELDESKFRCTLQARQGQNIKELEQFWSQETSIPSSKFYSARIDPRSGGKLTRKPDYKGVCRIDYLSTNLLYEVLAIGRILTKGP